jgi:simple sugar transport system substrate-binding protein
VRQAAAVGATLVVALLVSACDAGGDDRGAAGPTATAGAVTAPPPAPGARDDVRIVVVTHGQAADAFWALVKNGIDQAARDLAVDVSYRASDVYAPARMRRLVEAALAERPDGLVVTLPNAWTFAPALRKAARLGIPVVAINSGAGAYRRLGALTFVGQPDYAAGVAAGRRMAAAGVRSAICVVHQAGVANLEQRCRGFSQGLAEAGGRSIDVEIKLQQQQEAVGRLLGWVAGATTPIDGILTLGPAGATPALAALREERAFGKVKLATFDLAPDILRALRAGQIEFAIDEQPYLQGYYPIVVLAQHARSGLMPAAGTTIATGPIFVTRGEAAALIREFADGVRY